jgi:hypothetical protein
MCDWIHYFAVQARLMRGIKREMLLAELGVPLGEPEVSASFSQVWLA